MMVEHVVVTEFILTVELCVSETKFKKKKRKKKKKKDSEFKIKIKKATYCIKQQQVWTHLPSIGRELANMQWLRRCVSGQR